MIWVVVVLSPLRVLLTITTHIRASDGAHMPDMILPQGMQACRTLRLHTYSDAQASTVLCLVPATLQHNCFATSAPTIHFMKFVVVLQVDEISRELCS